MDWFLYDNDLRHERVKSMSNIFDSVICESSKQLETGIYYRLYKLFRDGGLYRMETSPLIAT